jgi:hypothetical protein
MAYKRITEEFKSEVIAAYQGGMSLSKLKQKFGTQSQLLQQWMKKRGITPREPLPCRIRKLCETVFEDRNEASDYWAGFLAADGCVSENVSTHGKHKVSWIVTLQLSERDADHVKRFREFLRSDYRRADQISAVGTDRIATSCHTVFGMGWRFDY